MGLVSRVGICVTVAGEQTQDCFSFVRAQLLTRSASRTSLEHRYGYSWIGVWKSPTMANGSWELLRDARDDSWPHCTYFRVHVVFNRRTNLHVLWVNLNGGEADYAVGTSASPEGPFKFTNYANAAVPGGGDFDILIDDDDDAYLIYTGTRTGHTMSVEKLSADYLTSLAAGPPPPPPTPPSPPPPEPGFTAVGTGACRDSSDLEPPFFTNEQGALQHGMTLVKCVATCKSDASCTVRNGWNIFCISSILACAASLAMQTNRHLRADRLARFRHGFVQQYLETACAVCVRACPFAMAAGPARAARELATCTPPRTPRDWEPAGTSTKGRVVIHTRSASLHLAPGGTATRSLPSLSQLSPLLQQSRSGMYSSTTLAMVISQPLH
jgi:hypothetical protein